MALAPYHLDVKTIGRSKGRSATAACAYRSGERIEDRATGKVFDYSRRGGVERPHCEIFAPADAPAWVQDRQTLWNEVEAAETRKNSTVAREFEVALPADLSAEERQALVRQFATALVERHGMVVDVSVHTPDHKAFEGQGNRNHHAHILCSTRRIGPDGFGAKVRELDNQRSGEVEHWREAFATMCGDALERAGHSQQAERWRFGHLRKDGQIEAARMRGDEAFVAENEGRVPTKHYGPNIIQIERKGMVTERGERARVPERLNAEVIDFAEARARIENERQEVQVQPAPAGSGILAAARSSDRKLLNVPTINAPRPREIVLRQWQAEKDQQFRSVQQKAERVDAFGRGLLARHEKRQEDHRRAKPAEPTGLMAGMKRGAYEVATKAWEQARDAIQRRVDRLSQQIDTLAGYMRKAFPHEAGPSKGEQLAERKAEQAKPALAAEYHQQQEQTAMAKDATLYTRADRDVRADQARLERDGKLAANLAETVEKEAQQPAPKMTEQEKRVQEARERIKAQRDRERDDNEKGKSRGHGR